MNIVLWDLELEVSFDFCVQKFKIQNTNGDDFETSHKKVQGTYGKEDEKFLVSIRIMHYEQSTSLERTRIQFRFIRFNYLFLFIQVV